MNKNLSIIHLYASKCTRDDEKNKNNDEMKRKRGLDLLGHCLVASEAPQDEAWLHRVFLQHFFTFFSFKDKGKLSSKVALLQVEVAFDLNSE